MSKQKNAVLSAVMNSCDHPTAEVVLLRCKKETPSINVATVYRNLNALIKEGLIKRVVADGGDRFDKTLSNHAHFQCNKCGVVSDVDCDLTSFERVHKSGVLIDSVEVSFKGVCKNCNK